MDEQIRIALRAEPGEEGETGNLVFTRDGAVSLGKTTLPIIGGACESHGEPKNESEATSHFSPRGAGALRQQPDGLLGRWRRVHGSGAPALHAGGPRPCSRQDGGDSPGNSVA